MSPPQSHFSSGEVSPAPTMSLKTARSYRTRPSVDGEVIPPAGHASTKPLDVPKNGIADMLKGRSKHFRQKSRMSELQVDVVPPLPERTASASSTYSQDSPPAVPKRQETTPRVKERRALQLDIRDSLRTEKLEKSQPVVLKGRTLQGWPRPESSSSLDVNVGDDLDSEDGSSPGAAERLLEMSIQLLTPTKSQASRPEDQPGELSNVPKPLVKVVQPSSQSLRPPLVSMTSEHQGGSSTLVPSPEPSLLMNAPPPSLSSKRSIVPPPLSTSSKGVSSSEADDSMPRTPKDGEFVAPSSKKSRTASITATQAPSARSRKKRDGFDLGESVVFDAGAGWTYGTVANKAQKATVKRNDAGFFECSTENIYAILVDNAHYQSPEDALKRAPANAPLFLCQEQVIISKRGLRLHAKTTALHIKRKSGDMRYIYGLRALDPEVAHHSFTMPEAAIRKLPCLVDERSNTVLFCGPGCHRVPDKTHWFHAPAL